MAFPPLGKSDHVVVSVSIDFPSNSQQDAPFHHIGITSQKLGTWDFWQIASTFLNKGKSAIPPLFNVTKMLSSASDKAKLLAENFSKNSNLNDSGISLRVFPSRTNLKLYNISVSPKMVKKVIANLDLSKASGPDCIPVVVLKNCGPEFYTY